MDGDGQMDASDMPNLLDAIIDQGGDFAKGNLLAYTVFLLRLWGIA